MTLFIFLTCLIHVLQYLCKEPLFLCDAGLVDLCCEANRNQKVSAAKTFDVPWYDTSLKQNHPNLRGQTPGCRWKTPEGEEAYGLSLQLQHKALTPPTLDVNQLFFYVCLISCVWSNSSSTDEVREGCVMRKKEKLMERIVKFTFYSPVVICSSWCQEANRFFVTSTWNLMPDNIKKHTVNQKKTLGCDENNYLIVL